MQMAWLLAHQAVWTENPFLKRFNTYMIKLQLEVDRWFTWSITFSTTVHDLTNEGKLFVKGGGWIGRWGKELSSSRNDTQGNL